MLRAYPGTSFEWWLQQCEADERLVATAIDILDTEGHDDEHEDG